MAITTNREYLTQALSKFNLSADDIELILVDNALSGTDAVNVLSCKNAIYASMSAILPTADVKEGSYSITWNIEKLKMWYSSLCSELHKPNALRPKIRNRSNYW